MEKPLYENSRIRIEYDLNHIGDHLLYLKKVEKGKDSDSYPERVYRIPVGCLQDIATTPMPQAEMKMAFANEEMFLEAKIVRGLHGEVLHSAIVQGYKEEEKRYRLSGLVDYNI